MAERDEASAKGVGSVANYASGLLLKCSTTPMALSKRRVAFR